MDIQKYQPTIQGVLRKLKVPPNQREDLTQDCYLAILENEAKIEETTYPFAFVEVLCRNKILDLRRDGGRHNVEAEELDDPRIMRKAAKLASSLPRVNEEMMKQAMETLSDDEAEVVSKMYVEGYHRAEIAAVLGVHPNTVDNRAKSGVAKLKKYFGEK